MSVAIDCTDINILAHTVTGQRVSRTERRWHALDERSQFIEHEHIGIRSSAGLARQFLNAVQHDPHQSLNRGF